MGFTPLPSREGLGVGASAASRPTVQELASLAPTPNPSLKKGGEA